MSLINKMLQDLDRWDAMAGADKVPTRVARPIPARSPADEWLWRVVAVLMIVALGWVGWVAYQLQPQPALGTDKAFQAEKDARLRAALAKPVQPPAQPPETFRLARSIETPILERPAKPALQRREAANAPASPAPATKGIAAAKSRVERRNAALNPAERAEAELQFHYAVELLKRGRGAEAEEAFVRSLQLDSSHQGARQALIALHVERGEIETASRLLKEGLAKDPARALR